MEYCIYWFEDFVKIWKFQYFRPRPLNIKTFSSKTINDWFRRKVRRRNSDLKLNAMEIVLFHLFSVSISTIILFPRIIDRRFTIVNWVYFSIGETLCVITWLLLTSNILLARIRLKSTRCIIEISQNCSIPLTRSWWALRLSIFAFPHYFNTLCYY